MRTVASVCRLLARRQNGYDTDLSIAMFLQTHDARDVSRPHTCSGKGTVSELPFLLQITSWKRRYGRSTDESWVQERVDVAVTLELIHSLYYIYPN